LKLILIKLKIIALTKTIKKLKTENPLNYSNVEYELFISPDNEKMKLYKQLDEIVSKINQIEEKIGKWNIDNKKNKLDNKYIQGVKKINKIINYFIYRIDIIITP